MSLTPAPRHYVLIFILSLSLLMLEIATARVLSVALLSHYAVALACMVVAGRVAAAAVGVARAPVASPRGARQSAAAS